MVKPVKAVIPDNINRSGYCCVLLDLDASGQTKNIRIDYCTEDILADLSIEAISQWKYEPFVKDGKPQAEQSRQVKTLFVISDWFGFIIPDRDMLMVPRKFMRKNDELTTEYEHLCKPPYIS